MTSKLYPSLIAKPVLLAVGLVVLPLLLASQTQARAPGAPSSNPIAAIVSLPRHSGINIKNETELKARLRYLVAHNPRAVKVGAKGCGCPLGAPAPGFADCLKRCMADAGVSAYSLIMCGAACVLSETGVGAVICAICVGVSVTVIEVCVLGCAENSGKGVGGLLEARAIRHSKTDPGSVQANVNLQTAKGT